MSDETGISWADSTFNPWVGCAKVSPGCAHCYAETWSNRYNRAVWGEKGSRVRTSSGTWAKPLKWEREHEAFEAEYGHRRRVFCASLADVFEPRLTLDSWRDDLFKMILATPHLDWLLLTKRPEYAKAYLLDGRAASPDEVDDGFELGWVPPFYYDGHGNWGDFTVPSPLPNVWLGVSIENSRFTWRADVLREIPAEKRFISAEPLLGSLYPETQPRIPVRAETAAAFARIAEREGVAALDLTGIDWVIVGGESGGRQSRPMHPTWAREIRDAIVGPGPTNDPNWQHHVPGEGRTPRPALHFKQWGSYGPVPSERADVVVETDGRSRRAADALPSPTSEFMRYNGSTPTSSGKLLDGVEWCEVP